ncbi:uroporphyrinogen-III synthase [Paenibacillus profundus]|uniref:Uroporphyrinogen-III synthase n=1 Tax=Paenibacillus profundus TaxID=1173085 RepID=A0ABS8YCY0_9BACL|nr:uroporphyrinogen-III synthase [Paenibacillus profundus]MCE5168852.1 uroporphyrinogen-III synthase [Paenibacillus profundus]
MSKCEGKVIALTGPRKAEEMATIVSKQGGTSLIRPTQGTMFEQFEHLEAEVDKLIYEPIDWAIWTTGMGVDKLVEAARAAGKGDALLAKLAQLRHAARGYKTVNALRRLGLAVDVRDDDGSTLGLIRALRSGGAERFAGTRAALQLHGDPAPALVQFLQEAGAESVELMPYRHTPPEDSVLRQLTEELLEGKIDAVAMTSAPQARFLFAYAREQGLTGQLLEVFKERTLMAAVGKVTAAAIADEGVERILVPEEERMGALIVTLSQWFEQQHS